MRFLSFRWLVFIGALLWAPNVFSAPIPPPLNSLVLKKAELESQYGIKRLECFPFIEAIGNDEDEARWVGRCLSGANTLSAALQEVPDAGLTEIGVSTRFLRVGGFQTLLIKWDATKEDMVEALKDRMPKEEEAAFLDKVGEVKRDILTRLAIRELYCTKTISNEDCLKGYQTLAKVARDSKLRKKEWGTVVVTHTAQHGDDLTVVPLKFDASAMTMWRALIRKEGEALWEARKKVYERMKESYGKNFDRVLQVPNVFCTTDLTDDECMQGAGTLFKMSLDKSMADRAWGRVMINRNNTLIESDYDVSLKFDIDPKDAVAYFSAKPTRKEVAENVTLSEKLEKRVKNNAAGLRAVCDLKGLRSALCAQGLETFIHFLKNNRDFRVRDPWTEVMFVDGNKLSRVNFALNSKSRDTYIYVSADSDIDDMTTHLKLFGPQ